MTNAMISPNGRSLRPLGKRLWLPAFILVIVTTSCRKPGDATVPPTATSAKLSAMALSISEVMLATENQTTRLAQDISALYPSLERNAAVADASQYRLETNGVLHRPDAVKKGEPAVFVSGAVKVDDAVMKAVLGTEAMDPILKRITQENPAVVQVYYNDRFSYNRIFPPFDVLTQYAPGMEIPSYNFYYQADGRHNPERKTVWVKDPYVDPAGRGWMISCVAPVYQKAALEGVCGLDITVESIIRNFDLEGDNGLYMLASADGTVVATGDGLIQLLRLPALKNHRYVDTVRSDTFRTADYNILKSRSLAIRNMAEALLTRKEPARLLELNDQNWEVRAVPVHGLDWWLMEFTRRR